MPTIAKNGLMKIMLSLKMISCIMVEYGSENDMKSIMQKLH